MTRKLLLVVGIIGVLIATFIVSILYFSGKLPISPIRQISQISQPTTDNRQPTTEHVPQPNETNVEKGVGVPSTVLPVYQGSPNNILTFDLTYENDAYSFNKIIVREGDVLHINYSSPGGLSDLTFPGYNISQKTQRGERGTVEFQATAKGSFEFYCQICLAEPDKNKAKTRGMLLVVPK